MNGHKNKQTSDMNSCGNDYGTTARQRGLFLLTVTGSVFAAETHSRICVRLRNLILDDNELFISPDIVTHCTYVNDTLQALYCKGI